MRNDYHEHDEITRAIRGLGAAASEHPLEPESLERARVRASQLNGFPRFLEIQANDALAAGECHDRLHLVGASREAPISSERERAALVCGEELTLIAEREVPGTFHEPVRKAFSGDQLRSPTLVTVAIHGWNRLAVAFRSPVGSYVPRANAAQR